MDSQTQFILESIPLPALLLDDKACVVESNQRFVSLSASSNNLINRPVFELFEPDNDLTLKNYFCNRMLDESEEPVQLSLIRCPNSEGLQVELSWKKLVISTRTYWVLVFYPIDKLMQEIECLRVQASLDELTGIYNRRIFHANFDKELKRARRYDGMLALLLLDLDHFKQVNDTLGHHIGDELLKAFADEVSSVLRACDTFARIGGDEFSLLMPQTTLEQAHQAAQRIKAAASNAFQGIVKNKMKLSVSIGVAAANGQLVDKKALLKLADEALYKAKNAGRDLVELKTLTAA